MAPKANFLNKITRMITHVAMMISLRIAILILGISIGQIGPITKQFLGFQATIRLTISEDTIMLWRPNITPIKCLTWELNYRILQIAR